MRDTCRAGADDRLTREKSGRRKGSSGEEGGGGNSLPHPGSCKTFLEQDVNKPET